MIKECKYVVDLRDFSYNGVNIVHCLGWYYNDLCLVKRQNLRLLHVVCCHITSCFFVKDLTCFRVLMAPKIASYFFNDMWKHPGVFHVMDHAMTIDLICSLG